METIIISIVAAVGSVLVAYLGYLGVKAARKSKRHTNAEIEKTQAETEKTKAETNEKDAEVKDKTLSRFNEFMDRQEKKIETLEQEKDEMSKRFDQDRSDWIQKDDVRTIEMSRLGDRIKELIHDLAEYRKEVEAYRDEYGPIDY